MTASRLRVVDLERRYGRTGQRVLEKLRAAYVSHLRIEPADVRAIADEAKLPHAHVHGTATYYSDLHGEMGRKACAGTACFSARAGKRPTETAVKSVYCLGACYGGPALLEGERLVCEHSPGEPIAPIPWHVAASEPVVLAGLSGETVPAWHTYGALDDDGAKVLREVEEAGLSGRGGAAFPVATKWRSALEQAGDRRYLVANGDEGDPGSFADRLLMEQDPDRILEGMALTALACRATQGIVYVRSEYPAAYDSLCDAVDRARKQGHLGEHFDIEVIEGAGSYVAGEETALLRSVEGFRGGATVRPPYPTEKGLYGYPTVVNNVETLASVPWIVHRGAAAYRKLGKAHAPGTKIVCLNERFVRPGAYEVEFGVPLRTICEQLGGGLRDGRVLRALQVGGPLGGFVGPNELDVELTVPALQKRGVELGHGSLVAFDDRVSGLEILLHLWTFAADESCGNCTPCRIGSRRGLELAKRFLPEGAHGTGLETHKRLLDTMTEASLCGFGRGVAPAISSFMRLLDQKEQA
jgi:NADH:ubiquinone oxidoreductase subunit F (NADH-binding)/NADH:ubiquinone oxidoreductase subunit E